MSLWGHKTTIAVAICSTLMSAIVPKAMASTTKAVVFSGDIHLGGGLGYPCTPAGITAGCPPSITTTVKLDGKNIPTLNVSGGNHRSFGFSSLACAKASVHPGRVLGKQATTLCAILGFGVVWGWCGLAGGAGTVAIENLGIPPLIPPEGARITLGFKFVNVGGLLYFTGGNMTTNIHMLVLAQEPINLPLVGPSCLNKTRTTWTIWGAAVYKDIT